MITAYRITQPEYAEDLSGKGAETYGGRWNPKGVPMLHAASSSSLAFLEKLVNLGVGVKKFPPLTLVTIQIDADMVTPAFPSDWAFLFDDDWIDNEPITHILGVVWTARDLAVAVPSAVNTHDLNIISFPLHPDYNSKVIITNIQPFPVDRRLVEMLT